MVGSSVVGSSVVGSSVVGSSVVGSSVVGSSVVGSSVVDSSVVGSVDGGAVVNSAGTIKYINFVIINENISYSLRFGIGGGDKEKGGGGLHILHGSGVVGPGVVAS